MQTTYWHQACSSKVIENELFVAPFCGVIAQKAAVFVLDHEQDEMPAVAHIWNKGFRKAWKNFCLSGSFEYDHKSLSGKKEKSYFPAVQTSRNKQERSKITKD